MKAPALATTVHKPASVVAIPCTVIRYLAVYARMAGLVQAVMSTSMSVKTKMYVATTKSAKTWREVMNVFVLMDISVSIKVVLVCSNFKHFLYLNSWYIFKKTQICL